jgi:hypothetical protein
MSTASPETRALARRLLALEVVLDRASDDPKSRLIRICERLRVTISKIAGTAGYASLLSRALALAKAEVPSLEMLSVRADGVLEGLAESTRNPGPVLSSNGDEVLVAQLLGLLATFIGQSLTLRLLQDAWMDETLEGMKSSDEETR